MGGFFNLSVESAILYVKHLGWLDSTPEKSEKTRAEIYKGTAWVKIEPKPESSWLLGEAFECGISVQSSHGMSAISWSEIKSWMDATGRCGWWLANAIHKISIAYINQFYKSRDPSVESPISDEIDIAQKRKAVSDQFNAFIAKRT